MEEPKSSVYCSKEKSKDLSPSHEDRKNLSSPSTTDVSENKDSIKTPQEKEILECETTKAESLSSSNSISAKIKTMHVQDITETVKVPENVPSASNTRKHVPLSLAPESEPVPTLGTKPSFFNKPRMPFLQTDNSTGNSTSVESSDIVDIPKSKKPRLFGSANADVLEKSGGNYFSLALKDCPKIGELTANLKETSTLVNAAPKPKALFGGSNDTGILSNDANASIITGEEDETNILKIVGKLYIFSSESGVWKERGRGMLKLNEKFVDGKAVARLVMRASGSLRVILNSLIFSAMDVKRTSETTVRFSAQYNDSIKIFSIRASAADCERLVNELDSRVQQSADPNSLTMERKWLRLVFLKPCTFANGIPTDTSLNFSLEEYLINNDWIQYIVKLNDDCQTFFDEPLCSAFSFEIVNKQLKIELTRAKRVYILQFLDILDLTEVHAILDRIMKSEFSPQRKFHDNSIHFHWVPLKKSKQETSSNDETNEKEESRVENEEDDEEDDSDGDDDNDDKEDDGDDN